MGTARKVIIELPAELVSGQRLSERVASVPGKRARFSLKVGSRERTAGLHAKAIAARLIEARLADTLVVRRYVDHRLRSVTRHLDGARFVKPAGLEALR